MSFRVRDLDEMRKNKEKEAVVVKKVEPVKTELFGHVKDIDRLNVRKEPEGEVISVILRSSEVKILEDPGESWLKIVTPSGLEGWVMRQFIKTFEANVGG